MQYRARYMDGTLRLLTNTPPAIEPGETVIVTIERARSMISHRHAFAWLKDAWLNLPESLQSMPWAETPDTMRKHALIATGYHQIYTIDCIGETAAVLVKAALVAAEAGNHGYAIGQINGPVVTIWTPRSQSVRAMGGKVFQESKTAILEWIADKIGVGPEQLKGKEYG